MKSRARGAEIFPSAFLLSTYSSPACTALDGHAQVAALRFGQRGELRAEFPRCRRATRSSSCFGST